MGGIFGIGISGLNAAQAGLVTTGHNIANASTPGYHRQAVVQSNAVPLHTGAGFVGQGTQVETIRRVYSDFLDSQAARAQGQASYYSAYSTQLSQIDNLLSDPGAGLAPALQGFFAGVNDVASNPASVPSRQALLSSASTLVSRFQTLDNRLSEMYQGVNAQVESTISTVNAYAREIASLNGRIAQSHSNPQRPANDLLDQRDHLVSELNSLVGATAFTQSDGSVNVSIGTGQSIVVGPQASRLAAVPSPEAPGRVDIAFVSGGNNVFVGQQMLTGGSLGALLAFRAGPLAQTQNDLGRIAAGLAESFNAQHALGQDLRGSLGGDFFVQPQPLVTGRAANTGTADIAASIVDASGLTTSDYRLAFTGGAYQLTRLSDNTTTSYAALPQTVDGITIQLAGGAPANGDTFLIEPTRYASRNLRVALTDTAQIAAGAPMRTGSAMANAGTGTISAGTVNAPLDGNVQQPVTITFTSATTFNVTGAGTGNPVGVVFTPGADITYNGWTVSIAGAPAAGDAFTVGPNTNGSADNRNALLLAGLQVTNTLKGGTASYQDTYGQLTSAVGNITREMDIASEAHGAVAVRARETQQSVSGVNLDEEAANLMRYQQAYQASGKVIEIASRMFETLLGIGP